MRGHLRVGARVGVTLCEAGGVGGERGYMGVGGVRVADEAVGGGES